MHQQMIRKAFKLFTQVSLTVVVALSVLALSGCHQAVTGVLNPKGIVAYQERKLLFDAIALMLVVVIPVIIMSFAFVYRYRESHKKVQHSYKPNWCHSALLESIWWGIPCAIILILGIVTWRTSHTLDPYRKIDAGGEPMLIQVVALPWKWLFIYPEQNIATVNFLELPKGRQVQFWLTSDNVPMSAFFIPQLGSQIYTMAGMRTRLHLLASEEGTFKGLNAQYNGDGFSEMHFKVKVVNSNEMNNWYRKVKAANSPLTDSAMEQLIKPVTAAPVKYFSSVKPGLFKQIIQSYKSK